MTAMAEAQPQTPQDLDAEEYVLSAMLWSPIAIKLVEPVIDPADFYRETHATIYRAIVSLHQLGVPVDVITVSDRLEEQGQLSDVGGRQRVHDIFGHAPAVSNVLHHARIIVREAQRRAYIHLGEQIARRAREAADPDEIHQLAAELLEDAVRRDDTAAGPTIAGLAAFVDVEEEQAVALAGDAGDALLPEGGLLIMGGEGGSSKTTLSLDAIAHLASGTAWLNYTVAKPLRILIIENEGPRPQFREKLRDKLDTWPGGPWKDNVHVWSDPWAQFSFAQQRHRRQLRDITRDRQIDLVFADPLDSLGVVGAGTPEDTRTFISWLHECGLHNPDQPLAFWLLHHFNKLGRGSIIDRLSGAWGGHPDAIIGVELGDSHATKITWGKLRHATPPANRTLVLAWNLDTRGFIPVQPDAPEAVAAREHTAQEWILEHVDRYPGSARTAVEEAFATHHGRGGRTLARRTIDRLAQPPGPALDIRTGAGPSPRGKYLFLAQEANSPFAVALFDDDDTAQTPQHSQFGNGESNPENGANPHEHSTRDSPLAETANTANETAASQSGADSSPAATPSLRRRAAGSETASGRPTPDNPDADLDALFGAPDPTSDDKPMEATT